MPRSEARIRTGTWRNQDFTTLTRAQQATYWMLLSQPDMNQAGVVPYVPLRWHAFSADDPDDIHADLGELHERRYLLVDSTSGEVWVRSFAKHDGVLRSPKTRAGMWAAYRAVLSTRIRRAFVAEIGQTCVNEAIENEWITRDDLPDTASDNPWDHPPHTPQEGGSDTPSDEPDALWDTPSDTPSPRARAASTTTSVSTSASARSGADAQNTPAERPRDPLFEAVVNACGWDWTQLTSSARGNANKATKELRQVGADPDAVYSRAGEHSQRWPGCDVTPSSLAKNWSQLGTPRPVNGARDGPGMQERYYQAGQAAGQHGRGAS